MEKLDHGSGKAWKTQEFYILLSGHPVVAFCSFAIDCCMGFYKSLHNHNHNKCYSALSTAVMPIVH